MTMALTFGQAFIGVLTIGVGLSRGIEADVSVQTERLTGDANYAASRVAAAHAKASNAIADDNVLAAAAMGPRLAVEADVITMDENAAIACPNPFLKEVCAAYTANRPRAAARLAWIRTAQMSLWASLELLSGSMHQIGAARAQLDVTKTLAVVDPGARLRFDDPAATRDPFASRSAGTGCTIAKRDALLSPMVGHAFPLLMPNLLEGLPQALVASLPIAMCPNTVDAGPIRLPEIPSVKRRAKEECDQRRADMKNQVEQSGAGHPVFSSGVEPFVTCAVGTTKKPLASSAASPAGVSFVVRRNGKLYTCTFDDDGCTKKRLEAATSDFLKLLGLASIPSFAAIGGSTRSPSSSSPNDADDFRASVTATEAPSRGTVAITDATRTLLTFGGAPGPSVLARDIQRTSSGRWYFPTGGGNPLAIVPRDHQAFVAGWKHALVAPRPGGR
ncbi:MAG: hypothetical protein JST00_20625 [Deltaproteobacteria bacterium]|nr:hypothetical protein [Deltaproteobacteria bacterium]